MNNGVALHPRQRKQREEKEQSDITMLAENLEVDAVRVEDIFGIWCIPLKNWTPPHLEAATRNSIIRYMPGSPPCVNPTQCRLVLFIGVDGTHALVPLIGHDVDDRRHGDGNQNGHGELVSGLEPEDCASEYDRHQGSAGLTADDRNSGQQHGDSQSQLDESALFLKPQVTHERNRHDQCQGDLVVTPDEPARAIHPMNAAIHDCEYSALDAVETQRQDDDPDK